MEKIKIPKPVLINIKELKPHPNNLKKHPEAQIITLIKLIEMVGFKDPIVIDKKFNVKAGHGRLEAAKKLKMKNVPCIYIEGLTQKQMDLFMYLDNHVNESPWIQDNIDLIFEDIPLMDLEQFPEINWNDIITQSEINEGPIPEKPTKPKSKLGDIYQLGNHRVMCGDSKTNLTKLLNDKEIDFLLTDPPYGKLKIFHADGRVGTNNVAKKRNFKPYHDEGTFKIDPYLELIKKTKRVVIWGGNYFSDKLPIRTSWFCWDKRAGKHSYFSDFELAWSNLPTAAKMFDFTWAGMIRAGQKEDLQHPTQKPIELFKWIIETWAKKDDLICDLFLGSGSTLIACELTNRICYGMEIDPAYVDVIVKRWENFTGKTAKLLKSV